MRQVLLPAYTVANGHVGLQPRETLVQHFGATGALPAAGLLAAAVFVGWLLAWGRAEPAREELTVARAAAMLVFVLTGASVVAFHLVGALTLPLGAALVVAAHAPTE